MTESQQLSIEQTLSQAKKAMKQGNTTIALQFFNAVLQHQPNHPVAKKGLRKLQKGVSQDQSVQVEIVDPSPEQINSLVNLYYTGQMIQTEQACRALLQTYPLSSVVINLLGASLQGQGKLQEAVESFDKVIQLKPDYAAYSNRGNVLKELGQLEEAVESYGSAIQLKPDFAEAYSNCAVALQKLGQFTEAKKSSDEAIQLKPDFAEAYYNRGAALQELGQFTEAKKSCDRAIQLKPDFPEAYSNQGSILQKLGQLAEAVESYDRAIQLKPDYADAYYNRGVAFQRQGQLAKAIENYDRAIQFKPDYVVARWNLSLLQLNNGYLSEGFKNYEARWKWDEFPSWRREFSIPRWNGETLTGKSILIWAEQGIGDEIQFATLIPEFEKLECHVGIECAPKLVAILQWSFPWADVRETGEMNCKGSVIYSQFDYQIPMGSLAPQFRKTLNDFRNFQKPFIPRLKEGEIKVRNKLNLQEGQLLIGLCWRSSKQGEDKLGLRHDLRVEDLAPLKIIKGAVFLAVQYDDCLPELEQVRSLGLPIRYYTNIDQKDDISSTCALLGACDFIISATTAVFQLAGSLGVPTLKFDAFPCYFDKIPWHPSVRELELNSDKPSLLIEQILSEIPEIIDWANIVTTSGRCIDSYKDQ